MSAIVSDIESDSNHKKLLAVTQLRLEKFVSLFAKVLVRTIRILFMMLAFGAGVQEALRVFPQTANRQGRKLFRTRQVVDSERLQKRRCDSL
jgi:hypothetical protein